MEILAVISKIECEAVEGLFVLFFLEPKQDSVKVINLNTMWNSDIVYNA